MSKLPGPIIPSYPALHLGISPRHFQLALFCKKIFGPERKRKLSQLSHHSIILRSLSPLTAGFHLPMGFTLQFLSVISCEQLEFVQWNENHCSGFALGWLDHDWGGWKSLVLEFVKQRGAERGRQPTALTFINWHRQGKGMECNYSSDKSQLMPIMMCR